MFTLLNTIWSKYTTCYLTCCVVVLPLCHAFHVPPSFAQILSFYSHLVDWINCDTVLRISWTPSICVNLSVILWYCTIYYPSMLSRISSTPMICADHTNKSQYSNIYQSYTRVTHIMGVYDVREPLHVLFHAHLHLYVCVDQGYKCY